MKYCEGEHINMISNIKKQSVLFVDHGPEVKLLNEHRSSNRITGLLFMYAPISSLIRITNHISLRCRQIISHHKYYSFKNKKKNCFCRRKHQLCYINFCSCYNHLRIYFNTNPSRHKARVHVVI